MGSLLQPSIFEYLWKWTDIRREVIVHNNTRIICGETAIGKHTWWIIVWCIAILSRRETCTCEQTLKDYLCFKNIGISSNDFCSVWYFRKFFFFFFKSSSSPICITRCCLAQRGYELKSRGDDRDSQVRSPHSKLIKPLSDSS